MKSRNDLSLKTRCNPICDRCMHIQCGLDGKLLAISTCVAMSGHHWQTQDAIFIRILSLPTLLAPCKGKVSMLDGPFGCTEKASLVAPSFTDSL